MPNEISDAFHNVEHWVEGEAEKFAAAVDREWVQVRPDVINIGKTVASQVMTAAVAYFTGGANMSQAIASVVSQLPAELKSLEHVAVTLFGLAVTDLQSKATTPPAAA